MPSNLSKVSEGNDSLRAIPFATMSLIVMTFFFQVQDASWATLMDCRFHCRSALLTESHCPFSFVYDIYLLFCESHTVAVGPFFTRVAKNCRFVSNSIRATDAYPCFVGFLSVAVTH